MSAEGTLEFRDVGIAARRDIVNTLISGFFDDPVAVWMFPDPQRRCVLLNGFFESIVEYHLEFGGRAIGTPDLSAVTLFFPPDMPTWSAVDRAQFQERLAERTEDRAEAVSTVLTTLEEQAPADLPAQHYHSSFTGVRPAAQNSGLGARLLDQLFDLADRDAVGIYAEVSTTRLVSGLQRVGFRRIGEVITIPGGPVLYPVWYGPKP